MTPGFYNFMAGNFAAYGMNALGEGQYWHAGVFAAFSLVGLVLAER